MLNSFIFIQQFSLIHDALAINYKNTSGTEQQQKKNDEDEDNNDDDDAVGCQVYFTTIYWNYFSSLFQQKASPWAVWRLTPVVLSYIQYLEKNNSLKIVCNCIYKAITTIFCYEWAMLRMLPLGCIIHCHWRTLCLPLKWLQTGSEPQIFNLSWPWDLEPGSAQNGSMILLQCEVHLFLLF